MPAAEGSSTSGVSGARGDGNTDVQVPRVAPPVRVMLPMLMRTLLLVALIVRALVHVKVPSACQHRKQQVGQLIRITPTPACKAMSEQLHHSTRRLLSLVMLLLFLQTTCMLVRLSLHTNSRPFRVAAVVHKLITNSAASPTHLHHWGLAQHTWLHLLTHSVAASCGQSLCVLCLI